MTTDQFNIMMQAAFVNHPVDGLDYKNMLLQVTGLVREQAVKEIGDDGVSQAATIKTGVASVGEVKVPNPVYLAPYRTFAEIEQPVSLCSEWNQGQKLHYLKQMVGHGRTKLS